MSTASLAPVPYQASPRAQAGALAWLCALFFLSGISGLMYQVVWVRMLTRVLGSTVYATSTVLAAFMAGLALGSLLSGRYIDRVRQPLRWYAALELGIGLSALATLALLQQLLPIYQVIYDFAGGSRAWLTAGQVVIALVVLLLPTALMGATLPALCAHVTRRHQDFARCVGVLYSLNTLGALVGVLASGFVLLGEFGETATIAVGAALNLIVAVAAAARGGSTIRPTDLAADVAAVEADATAAYPAACRWAVVATFGLGGFVALASEVIWARMLQLHQGTSIYAFSSMLAVVLAGISAGSFAGGRWLHRCRDPLRLLARVQLGVGLSILVALHLFPYLRTALFWPPVLLLSPVSLLWGLAFPLGAAAYTRSPALPGRSIGALYAWNTVGCIAGSLAAGFILIPCLGSSASLASLAAVSLLLGALLLTVHPQGLRQARASDGALAAAALLLLPLLGDAYYQALERRLLDWFPGGIEVHSYVEEAAATTIAFQRTGHSEMHKQLFVNGEGMTCLAPVTKLMAHLPLALADNPRDALVICMGMGTSLRSACAHEGLRVHAVELIPAVVRAFDFFHPDARGLLQQPQVHVVVDDGRNYLLLNQQKYDVITIDPPPPLFAAGTVNLYTRDFLALCRDRLQPQGVFCLWIQPDPVSENKMLFRSLLDVFEHVQVWTGPTPHTGFLMIATLQPLAMSEVPAKVRRLYDKPAIAADLRTWGDALDQPAKILDLYATSGAALRKYCSDAPLLADDRPYTEFPLWRRLRKDNEYHTIMSGTSYKQFPGAVDPYR